MATPAQVNATVKYIKNKTRQFVVRCNKETDADVIDYLEGCGNITEEIKKLVRNKLKKA